MRKAFYRWGIAALSFGVLAGCDLPDAKDQSNLSACADGTCEVLVHTSDRIDFKGSGGIGILSVEQIDGEVVGLRSGDSSNSVSGTSTESGFIQLNGLTTEVVAIGDGEAVLRFSS